MVSNAKRKKLHRLEPVKALRQAFTLPRIIPDKDKPWIV